MTKNEINMVEVPQTVKVRKYPIDNMQLCDLLRKSKAEKKINNKQIAKALGLPKTHIEHWFRRDSSFAIPDENVWFELKTLLGIITTKYDEAITTFDYHEGVYEKSHRVYISNGIAPTLTSTSADEKIAIKENITEKHKNQFNLEDFKEKRIGEINNNTQGLKMTIIDYRRNDDIDVLFDNGYVAKNIDYSNFKKGNVVNHMYPSVLNKGIIGDISTKQYSTEYKIWARMLTRCFDETYKAKHSTYNDVNVTEEWLFFPNFIKWLHAQDNWNLVAEHRICFNLDKDIIQKGNKLYCPQMCCLVPQNVNKLFTKTNKLRGNYPIGVTKNNRNKNKKYTSSCSSPFGVYVHYFETIKEAFEQYKTDKENVIKKIANIEYYDNKTITRECYDAMMKYEVEIDD